MDSVKQLFIIVLSLLLAACGEQNVPNNPVSPGGGGGGNSGSRNESYSQPEVAPSSDFTYQLQQPLSVSFTDRSSGIPTQTEWDFGDGTQLLKQRMYTSSIIKYPEQIILTNDNADTQVAVMFSYK
ncbi:MAG: PKD domain-containing protein [Paludibacteraceae bacterium]|nr:PKD domain-containing protein [Paludibacteraceae bacterium]